MLHSKLKLELTTEKLWHHGLEFMLITITTSLLMETAIKQLLKNVFTKLMDLKVTH